MGVTEATRACCALLILATFGVAAPADAAKCAAAKLAATGKRTAAALGCQAKAVGKGVAVESKCVAATGTAFETLFAKAESKGDCTTTGDAGGIAARVTEAAADVASALGGPGPSACTKLKLLAAGKRTVARFACLANANKKTPAVGVDPKCLPKTDTKFAQAFRKAEAKGDCLAPGGDDPAIAELLDALMVESRGTLAPPRTACAPLAPTTVHGNGFFANTRLARIVKDKVPCIHVQELTTAKCTFLTTPGSESGIWLESPEGRFAKVGQPIAKDGTPNGAFVVAADRAAGPVPCVNGTGMDTSGRVAEGTELGNVCIVEDLLSSYNALITDYRYWSTLSNWADGIVCSADRVHPDDAKYVGHQGLGDDVYCYEGMGAALNDINGAERDWLGQYYVGDDWCHYIVVGGFEVPGAKRPATRSLPPPGSVNTKTKILWRPVSPIDIANVGTIPRTPSPAPTSTPDGDATPTDAPDDTPTTTATPARTATAVPSPTATVTPEPDLVVDTTEDDPMLTDCDPGAPADCSLRGALSAAAGKPDPQTIALPAGTYVLTATETCVHVTSQFGSHNVYDTTSLCIRGKVTLVGDGAGTTIIDGNDTDRVLLVGNAGPTRVHGVTLQGGHMAGGSLFGGGGAINNGGDLTLSECVVRDSSATATGGGVYNSGTLAIERCTISGNTASTGGGVYVDSFNVPVDASIVDSTISDNHATVEHGGGVMVYGGNSGGTTTIRGTTIWGNDAAISGGGLGLAGLDGTLVMTNSTISGNRCFGYSGGGLGDLSRSMIDLRNVTITANRSEDAGGTNGAGGGI